MTWKVYPSYKPSAVEWLGRIPAQWKSIPLKYLCRRWALYGANEPTESYVDDGVRFLRTSDIDDEGRLSTEGAVYLPRETVSEYILKTGDLLISRSGTLGRTLHYQNKLHGECAYAGYLVRFEPSSRLHPQFAYYFTKSKSFQQWLSFSAIQSTIGNINGQKYANMPLPVPQIEEQRAIAAFLDQEAAKLDALMAKKEQLIELLQEKRTALITQAVTKGLDPNVPMKDSGVEWLGKIPAHWEAKRLWHLTPSDRRIMYGIVLPGPNVDAGVPIVKGGDVSSERLHVDMLNKTTFEIESGYVRSRLRGGDLVYAIRGSIGDVAVVPEELTGANITQDAARISYTTATHGRWLLYVLKCAAIFAQLEAGALGATIKGVNIRDLKRALVPVPPQIEQKAIAGYLDVYTLTIDALIAKIREALSRLNEYRTTLISAAVIGRIDVRATS